MRGILNSSRRVMALSLLTLIISGCSPQPIKCDCPAQATVPKELMQPARNAWLLMPDKLPASPTQGSSKTQPKTP